MECLQMVKQGGMGRKGGQGTGHGALPPLPRDGLSLVPCREAGTAAVEEEDYKEREPAWKQPWFTPSLPTEAVLGICLWEGEGKACGAQGETAKGTLCPMGLLWAPTTTPAAGLQAQLCRASDKGCDPDLQLSSFELRMEADP